MRRPSAGALRTFLARRLPWSVLVPLVLVQWIALLVFVTTVRHNSWLFYQGGDQTFFYTSAWVVGHGHIPQSSIGFAWPYVLAPLTWIFGANVLRALPAIVLLQVLVLLPLSTFGMYGLGARLGGRLVGYLAAFWWVVGPYAAIPLWDHRYHEKYVEQFLPQALGLTGLGDFPSTVCLIVAALFVLRALDGRSATDAVVAGLAAGFALGIKPANALFLGGPALAFVAARRWREAAGFAAALAPGALALAVWKLKGLGYLPILQQEESALAAGAQPVALTVSRYTNLSWDRLHENYLQLREFFWSVRLVQWIPLAGFVAVARRSLPKALLVAGWLAAFVLVKGASPAARVEDGSFLRLFMPGIAPFVLFGAALPLLWPHGGPRLADRLPARMRALRPRGAALVTGVVVFAAVPLVVCAALPSLKSRTVATYFGENVFVPLDGFALGVVAGADGSVALSWPRQHVPAEAFYQVFRLHPIQLAPRQAVPPPAIDGVRCVPKKGAQNCSFEMGPLAAIAGTQYVDRPPRGNWTYRIGMTANWLDDRERGDVMLVSRPVQVTVR